MVWRSQAMIRGHSLGPGGAIEPLVCVAAGRNPLADLTRRKYNTQTQKSILKRRPGLGRRENSIVSRITRVMLGVVI